MSRIRFSHGVLILVSFMMVFALSSQVITFNVPNSTHIEKDELFVKMPNLSSALPRSETPESRYGFTVNLSWTSSDSFLVRDVDTGDIDGDNDMDIVSAGGTTCKVYKNDGTGASFSDGWSAPGLTGIATNVKVVDADGDSDLDIVLLTQTEIPEVDGVYSSGSVTVYVYENDGSGTFSLGDSQTLTSGFVNFHEYYWTGYIHMAVGETNGDGNVDIAVSCPSGASGQSTMTWYILSYNGVDTLTADASRTNTTTSADGWVWGYVGFGDFDGAGNDDLVACMSGFESSGSGPLRPAECYVFFNSGTSPAATGTVVGAWNYQGAQYGNYIYSMIVGDCTDEGQDDIIIGTNYDLGGAYTDGMIWVCKGLGSGNIKTPDMWYQTTGHWQPRDLCIGNFDVDTGTDIIPNFWFENSNPPINWAIDTYSFEFGSGRQGSPVPKFLKKWEGKTGFTLPSGSLLCVGGGDFDKASPIVEDVVAAGSKTWVFTVCYPPNNLPKMTNTSWTLNPILNDGIQSTKLNITLQDLDGSDRDLGDNSVVIDLSPIGGLPGQYMTKAAYDGAKNEVFYHKTMTVADTTAPGLIKLPIRITDQCNEPYPGPAPGITDDNVTLTVQQFNRPPEVSDNAIKELDLVEDQAVYTIPDISDFFYDPDGDDLIYDLGSDITDEYNSKWLKVIYYDTDHHTKIIVKPNEFGKDKIPIRAHDGHGHTVEHQINITIAPINDAPVIINTGSNDWSNNSFELTQDLKFQTFVQGTDVEGDTIHFTLQFKQGKALFEIDEFSGEILYTPTNEDIGPHEAVIRADDLNSTNGFSEKTFWFNVTNVNDRPYFVKISDYKIDEESKDLVFNVTEHKWINFSIEGWDPDIDIGIQDSVFFSSGLSKMNDSFSITEDRNEKTKADVAFWAHGPGITCTVPEKGYGPLTGKLTVTDSFDYTLKSTINISFGIENVNDPPSAAVIDYPLHNDTFMVMDIEFVAGIVTDPDEIYGDEILYTWDFNDEDGINDEDAYGLQPKWEYEENGDYIVTLWVSDKSNLTNYAQILIHVRGDESGYDADGDGLPDDWELKWGLNPYSSDGDNGYTGDPDGDGVTNGKEMERHTDPKNKDTDGDGHWDGDDAFPNDRTKWKEAEAEKDWTWLILLLVVLAIIFIIVIVVVILVVVLANKKKKEEEEARAVAEAAAQEDPYAHQELYSDVTQVQQQMTAQPAEPAQAQPVEPTEALEFDRPEGIEPVEPAVPGPESPDLALPPGEPGAEPQGPDMDAPPGAEPQGPEVQLPPQGGQGPDLQPPPSLPPANENP
jgi:hypothetical protein